MAATGSASQSAGGIREPRSFDKTEMQILRTLTAEAIHRIEFRRVTVLFEAVGTSARAAMEFLAA
jgi:hypothetical protein